MKILLAEDDRHIRQGLAELLEGEGYEVVAVSDGKQALQAYRHARPDCVLLDIMMPGRNGYDVCREIRAAGDERIPILFISAKSEEIDRVLGLELGADDYIMKPFGAREVIARIRAVTRRALAGQGDGVATKTFTMGDLVVHPAQLRAQRGERLIELSLRDVKILRTLYIRRGEVVDRDTLFNECWGRDYLPSSRTLDQHISQLRKRIERDPARPAIIRTVHGAGYRYSE